MKLTKYAIGQKVRNRKWNKDMNYYFIPQGFSAPSGKFVVGTNWEGKDAAYWDADEDTWEYIDYEDVYGKQSI